MNTQKVALKLLLEEAKFISSDLLFNTKYKVVKIADLIVDHQQIQPELIGSTGQNKIYPLEDSILIESLMRIKIKKHDNKGPS